MKKISALISPAKAPDKQGAWIDKQKKVLATAKCGKKISKKK